MEIDNREQSNNIPFTSEKDAIFALNIYMNRFMWISTKEMVTGAVSCYYRDTQTNVKSEKR